MFLNVSRSIALLTIALCLSVPGFAQNSFIVFDAPDAEFGTFPAKINASGQIVGQYRGGDGSHGFLRNRNGSIVEFDIPGSTGTFPVSINNVGQIVGYFGTSSGFKGFLRNSNGTLQQISVPSAAATQPAAINDSGVIAGYYTDSSGAYHGFVRDSSGVYTAINAPGAGRGNPQGTLPDSIDTAGEIAGAYIDAHSQHHAFIRDASGVITTFDVPGGTQTYAAYLNNNGEVAGGYNDSTPFTAAFVRHADGTFSTFKFGDISTGVISINDGGYVCGNAQGSIPMGFLRTPAGNFILDSGPQPNPSGFCIDVNNNLRVTGNYADDSGVIHGWVR